MGIALGSGGKSQGVTPEMNVTPLVDVVLVLLIIFMVIAPSLEHGARVELPAMFQPDKTHKAKLDPITVTVAADGQLFFEKEAVATDVLKTRLEDAHAKEPDRRVVVKGDAELPYEKVRDVFGAAQKAGFTGVALMVSKRAGGKEEEEE